MNDYLFFIAIAWFISQTIKYFIRKISRNNFKDKNFKKTYLFFSGIPSTHTAVLTTTILLTEKKIGVNNEIFPILLLFSVFWIYEIFLQRKRIQVLINHFAVNKKEIVCLLEDWNGHALIDIFFGILVGIISFYLCSYIYYG